MKRLVALSALGEDRPGIVAALSKVLYENRCNLEDSSMTRLQGDFAVLLLISPPADRTTEDLRKAVEPVAKGLGLTFSLRELPLGEAAGPANSVPHTLVVYGVDHPGILYRISQAASDQKVNITDLRTHVTSSSQGPLYSLVMEVEIPSLSIAQAFGKILESLGKELKVEVSLKPVEAEEL